MNWVGVDYGSKMVGIMVIVWVEGWVIWLVQSVVKKDVDKWVKSWVEVYCLVVLYLDVFFSLFGVYYVFGGYEDFFYWVVDKEVQVMLFMFFGGLIVCVMCLSQELKVLQCIIFEVYLGQFFKILGLDCKWYKKDKVYLQEVIEMVLVYLLDY